MAKKLTKAEKEARAAKARAQAKKMTQSKFFKGYAFAGAGIDRVAQFLETGLEADITAGIPLDYIGFDPRTGENVFNSELGREHIVRGWTPVFVEATYRKAAQKFGFRAYPREKIENLGDFLDNLSMHAAPGFQVWQNRDSLKNAHEEAFLRYYGVDLKSFGGKAFQPLMALETKGIYAGQKLARKVLKDVFNFDVNKVFK